MFLNHFASLVNSELMEKRQISGEFVLKSRISNYKDDDYQRIECTPYGETWVEKKQNTGLEYLPYKFTGKELDEETGLYYYGARYLDPKYSRWISTDPALSDYVPVAPVSDETRQHNSNLPGMGGVFNHINGNLYHYAANNPISYVDLDGRVILNSSNDMMEDSIDILGKGTASISSVGCVFTSYVRIANVLGANVTLDKANEIATKNELFTDDNLLTLENGARLINKLLENSGIKNVTVSYESSYYNDSGNESQFDAYQKYEFDESEYFCNARLYTSNADFSSYYNHTVSVDNNALISDCCDGNPTNIRLRDTSKTGRTKLYGDTSGRTNTLERLDFFKVNKVFEE